MAGREEIKKITVVPSMEEEAYQIYSALGYTLVSSNEIYNKNTYDSTSFIEAYGGWKSQTTETMHYIAMVWKRIPDQVPNYHRLVELENRLDSLVIPDKPAEPFTAVGILLGIILCTIPGVIMFLMNIGRKKAYQEWEEGCERYWQARTQTIQEILSVGGR